MSGRKQAREATDLVLVTVAVLDVLANIAHLEGNRNQRVSEGAAAAAVAVRYKPRAAKAQTGPCGHLLRGSKCAARQQTMRMSSSFARSCWSPSARGCRRSVQAHTSSTYRSCRAGGGTKAVAYREQEGQMHALPRLAVNERLLGGSCSGVDPAGPDRLDIDSRGNGGTRPLVGGPHALKQPPVRVEAKVPKNAHHTCNRQFLGNL